MAGNDNVHTSRSGKTDEFYTQLSLVESELQHYRHHFREKIVLCNCDDPYESNFFKYFAMNFNALGLKKLITTCYATSLVTGNEFEYYVGENGQLSFAPNVDATPLNYFTHRPYKVEISEVKDENGDGRIDLADVEYLMRNKKNTMALLDGDGDFRSAECVELLMQADIVVTNPPFSLFRDYIALLIKHRKKFLVIGNQNALSYREIFPLIKNNEMWLGYNSGHFWFKVPDGYEEKATDFKIDENGQKWRRMGNICWYTNMDIEKRHENMTLFRSYSPEEYPVYDNYNAIEVGRTADIPCDYHGVMGVPLTFMCQYNPDQFEIVGQTHSGDTTPEVEALRTDKRYRHGGRIGGKEKFARILIRRKQVQADEN